MVIKNELLVTVDKLKTLMETLPEKDQIAETMTRLFEKIEKTEEVDLLDDQEDN